MTQTVSPIMICSPTRRDSTNMDSPPWGRVKGFPGRRAVTDPVVLPGAEGARPRATKRRRHSGGACHSDAVRPEGAGFGKGNYGPGRHVRAHEDENERPAQHA